MSNIHDVPRDQTFDKYNVIDRKPYSEHLTDFLNSKSKHGYVLNLNAEWGAGKTTFLQCWYNELKEKHPVVYFDAWKSDFTHDAMLAITECFHSQLMSPLVEDKERLTHLKDKGTHLIKVALPSLLVGYLKHKTGTDSDDSLFSDLSKEFKIEIGDDDLGDAVKETMKAMLNQKKKVEGIHIFRNSLEDLANSYLEAHTDVKPPIYVLVDELDRCRPTYAIEVIECIKHFFNTKNFVFILATDTDQLQHSIKAVYGEGFDSSSYLSRFFDRTATLLQPSIRNYIKIRLNEIIGYFPPDELLFDLLICQIFEWHGITSLREIEKVFQDIEVASSKNINFKVIILITLSILKRKYPSYYQKYNIMGIIPYSNTIVEQEQYLAHSIPSLMFPITKFNNINIRDLLIHVYQSINDIEYDEDTYLSDRSMEVYDNAPIKTFCRNLSNLYGTKKGKHYVKLTEYFSTLNFAGLLQSNPI
ncbi:hypothetical protein LA983_003058 [Vibrio fluvialis]|nr:hypothetical protein [Vibrio fluvialis]